MTVLPLVALVAAWALLHRESRKEGWGYVGRPPTPLEVAMRALTRHVQAAAEQMRAVLLPAVQRLTRAAQAFAEQLREAGLEC